MSNTRDTLNSTSASVPAAVASQPPAPVTPAPPRADAAAFHHRAPAAADNPFAGADGAFAGNTVGPANPFAAAAAASATQARRAALHVPDDAPPETYTYSLVKSGPDVRPEEVEQPGVSSVEVMILWGTNVLHVSHLTPPRDFYVGEGRGSREPCDFFLPEKALGTSRLPVVLADGESVRLVLPAAATGTIEVEGQPTTTIEQARRQAQPSHHVPGACVVALAGRAKARVRVADFVFQISTVDAGKRVPRGLAATRDYSVASYFGLSLLTHASIIAALAFFVPDLGLLDEEDTHQERIYALQAYLSAAAEREYAQNEAQERTPAEADESTGGRGERAKNEEGKMGSVRSQNTDGRYGVKGDKDNLHTQISRAEALREARSFGLIGLLNSGLAGDPNTPHAPWGADEAIGADEKSANGNMFGSSIDDAAGFGGLGLTGIGEGGGGLGEGIGLDTSGGIGHGAGGGWGQGIGRGGWGFGKGRFGGTHNTKGPGTMRPLGETTTSGRLPPEVIQRIVRQNYGRFRMCYEQGLVKNPNLSGRVAVRFVIDSTGAVANASNGGSDLPDSSVVSCVVRAYYGLSVPAPDGGIVTVNYPIMFTPG